MRETSMDSTEHFREKRGKAALWLALLAGPVVWILGFEADYALVRVACDKGTMLPLHLVTLASLALVGWGGLLAWREWQRAGGEWPGEGGGTIPRSRFMAAVGLMANLLFALVIVAQWLPKLFLHPCAAI